MSNFAFKFFCEKYKTYQSFDSLEAMKDSVRLFRIRAGFVLPASHLTVLEVLALHSTNVFGVSWMDYETIAEKSGYSIPTVERAIKALVEYGILVKQPRGHKKGGRRVVLVIQPYKDADYVEPCKEPVSPSGALPDGLPDGLVDGLPPAPEMPMEPYAASVSPDSSDIHKLKRRKSAITSNDLYPSTEEDLVTNVKGNVESLPRKLSEIVGNFLTRQVPDYFKDAISMALSPYEVAELWHRAEVCKKACRAKYEMKDLILQAWSITKMSIKSNAIETNDFYGFFYGTLRRLYENVEGQIIMDPDLHADAFYPQKESCAQTKVPFLTKAKKKIIQNIAKYNRCSFDEAKAMYMGQFQPQI